MKDDDPNLIVSSHAIAGALIMGGLLGLKTRQAAILSGDGDASFFSLEGQTDSSAIGAMGWAGQRAVLEFAGEQLKQLRAAGASASPPDGNVGATDDAEQVFRFNPFDEDEFDEPADDMLVSGFTKVLPEVHELAEKLAADRVKNGKAALSAVEIVASPEFLTRRRKVAMLSGPPTAVRRRSATTYSDRSIVIDEKNGIIRNVSLMTIGPALGHGFDLDETSIQMIADLVNATPEGIKVRVRHPVKDVVDPDGSMSQKMIDDFGTMVGRVKNARVDGQQARGDVYLGAYAEDLPGLGNMKKFLLSFAKEDPTGFGMSVLMQFDPEVKTDEAGTPLGVVARPSQLFGVDFVGQGAANPNGLLSAKNLRTKRAALGMRDLPSNPEDSRRLLLFNLAKRTGWQWVKPTHRGTLADLRWLEQAGWVETSHATNRSISAKLTAKGLTVAAAHGAIKR